MCIAHKNSIELLILMGKILLSNPSADRKHSCASGGGSSISSVNIWLKVPISNSPVERAPLPLALLACSAQRLYACSYQPAKEIKEGSAAASQYFERPQSDLRATLVQMRLEMGLVSPRVRDDRHSETPCALAVVMPSCCVCKYVGIWKGDGGNDLTIGRLLLSSRSSF